MNTKYITVNSPNLSALTWITMSIVSVKFAGPPDT